MRLSNTRGLTGYLFLTLLAGCNLDVRVRTTNPGAVAASTPSGCGASSVALTIQVVETQFEANILPSDSAITACAGQTFLLSNQSGTLSQTIPLTSNPQTIGFSDTFSGYPAVERVTLVAVDGNQAPIAGGATWSAEMVMAALNTPLLACRVSGSNNDNVLSRLSFQISGAMGQVFDVAINGQDPVRLSGPPYNIAGPVTIAVNDAPSIMVTDVSVGASVQCIGDLNGADPAWEGGNSAPGQASTTPLTTQLSRSRRLSTFSVT